MNSNTSSSISTATSTNKANSQSPTSREITERGEINFLNALLKSTKNYSSFSYGHFSPANIEAKLKGLQDKYHKMARTKSLIKTPHDRKVYKIADKIWGQKSSKASIIQEDFKPKNGEKQEKGGDDGVRLEDFPFLMMGTFKLFQVNKFNIEHLKSLGVEKLKDYNEKCMVLSMKKAANDVEIAKLHYNKLKLIAEAVNMFN